MSEVIDRLNKLVSLLNSITDDIDTTLLDESLLASRYTCSISELRVKLDLVQKSIDQLASQVSEMSEEE